MSQKIRMERMKQIAAAERSKKAQSGSGRKRINKGKQDVRGRSVVVEGRLESRVEGGKDRKVGIRDKTLEIQL